MDENVTIAEAKQARAKLHKQLSDALEEFTEQTGLDVNSVRVESLMTPTKTGYKVARYIVYTTVELDG